MDANIEPLLARLPILAGLPEEDRRRLAGYSVKVPFAAGDRLLGTDAPPDRVLALLDGMVAVDGPGRWDALRPHAMPFTVGDLIGIESVLEGACPDAGALALTDGAALAIAAEPFRDHLTARFDLLLGLLAATSARLRRTVHGITEIKLRSTTQRLAGYLVELAAARGRAGGVGPQRLVLPCEKHRLAERLGMQPESLSRAFARLRPQGVTTGRNEVVLIADVPALARFCRESEASLDP